MNKILEHYSHRKSYIDWDDLYLDWNEGKIKRTPKGQKGAGRFAKKEGGDGGNSSGVEKTGKNKYRKVPKKKKEHYGSNERLKPHNIAAEIATSIAIESAASKILHSKTGKKAINQIKASKIQIKRLGLRAGSKFGQGAKVTVKRSNFKTIGKLTGKAAVKAAKILSRVSPKVAKIANKAAPFALSAARVLFGAGAATLAFLDTATIPKLTVVALLAYTTYKVYKHYSKKKEKVKEITHKFNEEWRAKYA